MRSTRFAIVAWVPLFGETLHAPFRIFINDGQTLSDKDLVRKFGAEPGERIGRDEYQQMDQAEQGRMRLGAYVLIAETSNWKLVADNWHYQLWHRPSTRQTIVELAAEFDILAYSMGDSDDAYDLRRFTSGKLERELIVDDDHGGGHQRVLVDTGTPLRGERSPLRSDLGPYLSDVAAANGFDINDGLASARIWLDPNLDLSRRKADPQAETARRTGSWNTAPG